MKLFFILYFFVSLNQGINYEKVFLTDYKDALFFINKNTKEIKFICNKYKHEPNFTMAVVFPELIRYSIFKDFFETAALEAVYVKFGKDYADFSIGRFQMKPSFSEKIEKAIHASDILSAKYKEIIEYKNTDQSGVRLERVQRLKKLSWQLLYLNCFIDIVKSKFPDALFLTNYDKVLFYATAYNYDFSQNKETIELMINNKSFPYGGNNYNHQYSYGDIAIDFYRRNSKTIHSDNTCTNK